MVDWTRAQYGDETGVPWVLPSPNIPTMESAVVYPGTVLLEGTNISEGRGTTMPFELVGAPWAEPEQIADRLNSCNLPGVYFRPALFEPTFHKHAGTPCGGCQIHVTDRQTFRSVETGVAIIEAFRPADPAQFAWRPPPYEYEATIPPIDILYGSADLRIRIDRGDRAADICAGWADDVRPFLAQRAKYVRY